jgi:hypothetical protein
MKNIEYHYDQVLCSRLDSSPSPLWTEILKQLEGKAPWNIEDSELYDVPARCKKLTGFKEIPANYSAECSNRGYVTDGTCVCNFGSSGKYCEQNWGSIYKIYVNLFSVLFSVIALIGLVQFIRFIVMKGGGIQKLLHLLFIIFGAVRVTWLQLDPHNLKNKWNPIIENLINGFGIYIVVLTYMLVVMLWAQAYNHATAGSARSRILSRAKPLLVGFIIFYGVCEVSLRILWRSSDPDRQYYSLYIFTYYGLMMVNVAIIMATFIFYGIRLKKNFSAFLHVNPYIKERLRRITQLTFASSLLCILTFVMMAISLVIEMVWYHFKNTVVFLSEQFAFRVLEVILVTTILSFIWKPNYTETEDEREKLLGPGKSKSFTVVDYQANAHNESF